MAQATLTKSMAKKIREALPTLTSLPWNSYFVDYDEDADVLYISFQKPQKADDSELFEDGIIINFRNRKIVGVTILDASKR